MEKQRAPSSSVSHDDPGLSPVTPGKTTLTDRAGRRGPSVDQIADAVVQRLIARKADGGLIAPGADALVARATEGGGAPLPDGLRDRFESSLGVDLSSVRVHTDESAAEASSALGARAYASGQDVYMSRGSYAPDSADGAFLLAH